MPIKLGSKDTVVVVVVVVVYSYLTPRRSDMQDIPI